VTRQEALDYVIERLTHEANVRPDQQLVDVLHRKLAAIEALTELRAQLELT
jgi:hypothetical protein